MQFAPISRFDMEDNPYVFILNKHAVRMANIKTKEVNLILMNMESMNKFLIINDADQSLDLNIL